MHVAELVRIHVPASGFTAETLGATGLASCRALFRQGTIETIEADIDAGAKVLTRIMDLIFLVIIIVGIVVVRHERPPRAFLCAEQFSLALGLSQATLGHSRSQRR